MKWKFETLRGTATELHETAFPTELVPTVRKNVISTDAIVLGSSQAEDLINTELQQAKGLELGGRRTGGGIVYIDHQNDLWLDIFLPTSHPLSEANLDKSFEWLGECWLKTLTTTSQVTDFEISADKPAAPHTNQGALCFASMGYGEIGLNGTKIVGISQRRTRDWSKFQCLVAPSGGLDKLIPYLAAPVAETTLPESVQGLDLNMVDTETQLLLALAELKA